jgi:hypothetical protein
MSSPEEIADSRWPIADLGDRLIAIGHCHGGTSVVTRSDGLNVTVAGAKRRSAAGYLLLEVVLAGLPDHSNDGPRYHRRPVLAVRTRACRRFIRAVAEAFRCDAANG